MKFDDKVYKLAANTMARIETLVEHELLGVIEATTAIDNIRSEMSVFNRKMEGLMDEVKAGEK